MSRMAVRSRVRFVGHRAEANSLDSLWEIRNRHPGALFSREPDREFEAPAMRTPTLAGCIVHSLKTREMSSALPDAC